MNGFFPPHKQIALWIFGNLSLCLISSTNLAQAQVIPDGTLRDNSVVILNGNTSRIEGGTQVGGNLFHSFQEFSLSTGSEAFFNNAQDIQTILGRVTGGNLSNIDGTIRANGTANLFLINPNGIIFGPNAQLNIGGSFIASTANSFKFSDGREFSATNPQPPPLLTISVPIGLQFGSNPGRIVNQSQASSNAGLQVLPGRTLALVGGDVSLNGGNLTAIQGQIELGSVASAGMVSLTSSTTGLNFGYEGIQNFGTINLSGAAAVNASGLGGGTIRVRGGQVTVDEGSRLVAETFGTFNGGGIDIQANQFRLQDKASVSTSTFGSGAGGNLTVRADAVELTGTTPLATSQQLLSGTFNPLNLSDGLFSLSGGSGKAGDITLEAGQLRVQNGANLLTAALLNGNGGNLTLRISELAELNSGSLLFTGTAGAGNAGNIVITAKQLRVLNGTSASTTPGPTSTGTGGNLTVTADAVELRGTPVGALVPGGLFTTTLGTGDAGNINLTTDQLVVADGTQLSTSTSGAGRGGHLTVTADVIELKGKSADGRFLGGLLASASLLTVPGQRGNAPAGDLTISTRRLSVLDGSQISAATGSAGTAGNLSINASESVDVSGFATDVDPSVEAVSFGIIGDGIVPSAIETNTRGVGNAGDLTINTGRLTVRDGAEIGVRSTSTGSAGDLAVRADSILLENQGTLSAVNVAGSRGGNIQLDARTVQLNNGIINASTLGSGSGGDITIHASDLVEVVGSGLPTLLQTVFFPALFSTIDLNNTRQGIVTASAGEGSAGKITINTGRFKMQEGGLLATTTLGEGAAGDLKINASESMDITSSFIWASTIGSGVGGNIDIDTRNLSLQDVGAISAATLRSGKGGNLTIRASESIELSGALMNDAAPNGKIPTNLTAGAPLSTTGDSGDISITTSRLMVRDGAEVSVSSQGSGKVGKINANTGSVLLDNGAITATSVLGKGGDINLQVGNDLILRHRSQISTTSGTQATGGGDGGNITINTGVLALLEKSRINANAFKGAGGNIRITTRGLFRSPDSSITASSTLGVNGVVEINRLGVDPAQSLAKLPENFSDPSDRINTDCAANTGSSFVVTGRGGLPEDPTQSLRGQIIWRDLRPLAGKAGELQSRTRANSANTNFRQPIVEAQGWLINAKGQVELVANAPQTIPQTPWPQSTYCP
ncbi:MAG TPA: filamentous hemagglutinin N-terminal domain-containing protein [Waterburya sp.]|jgi:filamentous hemagglutinin family protein